MSVPPSDPEISSADVATRFSVEKLSGPSAWEGSLGREWDCLEKDILPRTPFTSRLWMSHWWKHFRRRGPLFRDEFFCHAVRGPRGDLAAIAPLMRTDCPGFGLPVFRVVQFFGADPALTEIRGVICRTADHDGVVRAIADYLVPRSAEWDILRWSGLHYPVALNDLTTTCGMFLRRGKTRDYIIDLPDKWDALKARVSSNMRKNLRKPYEFLERDGFRFVLRVVERPEDLQPAVKRFLSLHRARSEVVDMIDHPNKFATPHAEAFLMNYLHSLARKGELRIFELEIASRIVASRITFLLDCDLYTYFAGYDPTWRRYSVMTVLIAEIIKWAIERGLRNVNLSTGKDQSKLRWRPTEITFHDALQISPTSRGQLAFHALQTYEMIRSRSALWPSTVPRPQHRYAGPNR
jgi:Acetyltransferase (GNAT) domain